MPALECKAVGPVLLKQSQPCKTKQSHVHDAVRTSDTTTRTLP